MGPVQGALSRTVSLWQIVGAYIALTKPRIVLLLLVTAMPAMALAAGGWPEGGLMASVLLGGALAAGGANALNCYLERDVDQVMERTQRRPIPAGQVRPGHALALGLALGALGVGVVQVGAGTLPAALVLASYLFYVVVYTLGLKRATPLNIVIGGAAGAMPPLIGWTAVRGEMGWPGALMFGIVFLWTPVHFWALSLHYAADYRRAGVPMLPVVSGEEKTRLWIALHALATALVSLALPLVADVGKAYVAAAVALGGGLVGLALLLWRRPHSLSPLTLFHYSNLYLLCLFVAIGVDALAL
ncbi:MAG: heme o synthase [Dehalococcoidia bacterium]|nr:heme o synthase [Dehalococcoidia bacterium]